MNSRDKGQRGEREIAGILRDRGYVDARRGQQFAGGGDSPDVLGLPGYHLEIKWVNKAPVYHGIDQAIGDAKAGAVPVVFRKQDRKPWLAILRLEDFLALTERCR